MNYDEKKVPEIRIAPKYKAINPDKIPKRPVKEIPSFQEMNFDELVGFLVSHQNMKVNMMEYMNPSDKHKTKEKVEELDRAALRALTRAFFMHLVNEHKFGEMLLK